ncbi:branched-chain amino acid ABC transporter permease [Pectobacteriaceae bacterium CE70]|uniref:Branched-chain amino acid ABC transporter permease n=1 Tax=Serratia sp. (strain ATCC 39006) TaxID=104623 RepID=A0A2I5T4X3_SERS3|nr:MULTISPECIES: branched-chain amino acid ABC transporter permease [Enterobacterales]WJV57490.1 branched-chain amino acid ABC transporter permease [Pectobacteriaceae bacterium C111]WJV64811.1 branched-chain amino acid ABC transporter permease [Pectobacteriaceae bacterium C52]WJV66090.1 branched-chain amino acid ABC transporter permease [Pectobacteriaceae bacterium CE70]WJY13037.1 branched-chain amino acid ABC transporter permease [Pectobacteriaceae bacterium C80]WJY15840.1 branched-chain amin
MLLLSFVYSAIYQFGDNFAFLVLSALGLAVIFGMMGVINLAHGEFIMCGAYVTITLNKSGLPLPLAMLVGALVSAFAGGVIERLVVRHLYDRLYDSVVATWAISLIVQQSMLLLAGPSLEGLSTPFGSFTLGDYSFSTYRALLPLFAIAVLLLLYWLFFHTNYGVCARATIQNARMASCLGLETDRIYTQTFALGAGMAGLAGAIYAPTMTAVPTMGNAFIIQAFVSVVVGGANVLIGTIPAAMTLSTIQTGLNAWYGQLAGQIGLLITAMLVIRLLPNGVGSLFTRNR